MPPPEKAAGDSRLALTPTHFLQRVATFKFSFERKKKTKPNQNRRIILKQSLYFIVLFLGGLRFHFWIRSQ